VLGLWPAAAIGAAICLAGSALLVGPLLPGDLRALATALPGALAIALAALACGAWLTACAARERAAHRERRARGGRAARSLVYATSVRMVSKTGASSARSPRRSRRAFPGREVVYFGGVGLVPRWYLGSGPSADSAGDLAALLAASGSEDCSSYAGRRARGVSTAPTACASSR
jgi:hypothetical protein